MPISRLDYAPNDDFIIFEDRQSISGVVNQNFNIDVGADIGFVLSLSGLRQTNPRPHCWIFSLIIDDTQVIDLPKIFLSNSDTTDINEVTLMGIAPLTAGAHTARIEWRAAPDQDQNQLNVTSESRFNLLVIEAGDTSSIPGASSVPFTPDGDIAATDVQAAIVEVRDDTDTKLTLVQPLNEKGQANGYAELDATGRVPQAQLSLNALTYQGTWDANTNTPALASGIGTTGDVYCVSVGGTTNLDGISSWIAGDFAIFNGTTWEKIDNAGNVISVAGKTGVVLLVAADSSVTGTYPALNNPTNVEEAISNANDNWENANTVLTQFQTAIAANSAAISANDTDIATNVTNIATNATNIGSNDTDIAANTASIATNTTAIATNATNIATNAADILTKQDEFITVARVADGQAGVEAAVAAVDAAGGGVVLLQAGTYTFTTATFSNINNVTLQGQGDATIIAYEAANNAAMNFQGQTIRASSTPLNNTTVGVTTITTTTASNATNVQAGDVVIIRGTEITSGGPDAEYNVAAAAGDGGTGNITLKYRTTMQLSSCTVEIWRNNCHNAVKDMRFVESAGTADAAIVSLSGDFFTVENCTFTSPDGTGRMRLGAVRCVPTSNFTFRNNRVLDLDGSTGVQLENVTRARITDNTMQGLNVSGFGGRAGVRVLGNSYDMEIFGNKLYDIRGDAGIHLDQSNNKRISVSNNIIVRPQNIGIIAEGSDALITSNQIMNSAGNSVQITSTADRVQVADNKILNPGGAGINVASGGDNWVISNNTIVSPGAQGIQCIGVNGAIEGNNILASGSDSIIVSVAQDVVISDNTIVDAAQASIEVDSDSEQVVITANTISGSTLEAILLRATTAAGIDYCSITGNTIGRNNAAGNGINLNGASNCVVTANVIRGYTTNGIIIQDNSGAVGENNIVRNNNTDGNGVTNAGTGIANDIANNK